MGSVINITPFGRSLVDDADAATARGTLLPSKTGNTLKVLRVNAGETDYELATPSAGGSAPFDDATAIIKGSGDATKLFRIEADTNIPTGTTVVGTVPATSFTFAGLGVAQTFTAKQVFETGTTGTVPTIFRQTGGTPGSNELQASHNGTEALLENKSAGDFKFKLVSGSFTFNSGFYEADNYRYGIIPSVGFKIDSSSGASFAFVNGPAYNVPDATLYRLAAAVIGAGTTGATGAGWLQNSAGEAALASNFTKTNATLGNTNLSLTLIAGRSYRIEGYLIVSNSTASEGFQMDFNGGSATATTFDAAISAVGSDVAGTVVSTSLATVVNYTTITGTNRIFVRGYIKCNAGGTFILRAAENTTAAGTMTLAAGSWLALYDTVNL